MKNKYFGTDGIRGTVNQGNITGEKFFKFGLASGTFFKNQKTTYIERKKMGIDVTKNILNEKKILTKWIEYFDKHKKKDDLADSFLQALWYIKQ